MPRVVGMFSNVGRGFVKLELTELRLLPFLLGIVKAF